MALDWLYHAPWSSWCSLGTGFCPWRIRCDRSGQLFDFFVICIPIGKFLWPWIGSIMLPGLVGAPWGQVCVLGGSGVINRSVGNVHVPLLEHNVGICSRLCLQLFV